MERDSQEYLENARIEALREQRRLSPNWQYAGGGTFVMDGNAYVDMISSDRVLPRFHQRTPRTPIRLRPKHHYTKR